MPATPLPEAAVVTPSIPRLAVIAHAVNLPLASRFTIALAVSAFVGATFQFSSSVPLVVTGEPLTVKSETGALSPTLVTVPFAAVAAG
jgi:hypothetical protein